MEREREGAGFKPLSTMHPPCVREDEGIRGLWVSHERVRREASELFTQTIEPHKTPLCPTIPYSSIHSRCALSDGRGGTCG